MLLISFYGANNFTAYEQAKMHEPSQTHKQGGKNTKNLF